MFIKFADIYPIIFLLARFGPAFAMLPGIKGVFVPGRIKVLIGLSISMLLASSLQHKMPPLPASEMSLVFLLLKEVVIGVFIGMLVRLIFYTLEIAGQLLSVQSGFAAAQLFNPAIESQTGLIGTFLVMGGMVLIFVTDLYQIIFRNIVNSYEYFAFDEPLPIGDFVATIVSFVNSSFNQAIQLCIPVLIVITVFFICMGLMSRFIPGVQIFFISLPVQILLGLFIIMLTLTGFYEVYLHYFNQQLTYFPVKR